MPSLIKEVNIAGRKISIASMIWFALSLMAIIIQLSKGKSSFNNYLIFKGVFWHTIDQANLFNLYPEDYFDSNHYGVSFSLIIAPFALLPDYIGCFFWGIANAVILYIAIQRLPVSAQQKQIILLVAVVEMMTAMHNLQFNPMLTAFILLSWIFVEEKKDFWATLFIVLGIFSKIYGIVGLAFFLFSSDKIKFIGSLIFWGIVIFCLPMIFSSPSFVLQAYQDWYLSLTDKNAINEDSVMQGMSMMRLVKRGLHLPEINNIYFLIIGAIGCAGIVVKPQLWKIRKIRLQYLSLLLISVVIFSSSSESSTYIIAMIGVAIWYISAEHPPKWMNWLLAFAIILTSLSTTDLFPKSIKVEYIRPFALKALPCVLIWFAIIYQMFFSNSKKTIHQ